MARYDDDARYDVEDPFRFPIDIEDRFRRIDDDQQIDQVTPAQVTANQNDYTLPDNEVIRLSTDAARTFTGFAGARPGIFVVLNVGGFDVVIAHENAGSAAENRVISPTAANYTLNPNESAHIVYDFASLRWRITAGTGA